VTRGGRPAIDVLGTRRLVTTGRLTALACETPYSLPPDSAAEGDCTPPLEFARAAGASVSASIETVIASAAAIRRLRAVDAATETPLIRSTSAGACPAQHVRRELHAALQQLAPGRRARAPGLADGG